MSKVDQAISIIQQPATLERWQELQQLYAEAADEPVSPGDPMTEKQFIGRSFEAFMAQCPPEITEAIAALDRGRRSPA